MKLLLSSLLVLAAAPALAAPPNFNALGEADVRQPVPGPLPLQTRLRVEEGRIASVEARLGVPTFFWAGHRMGDASPRSLGLTAEQAARRHLYRYAGLYRQAPGALAEATLHRLHDTGEGAIIASFQKVVEGTPVFRDALKVIMDRELRLVALSGYLPPFQEVAVRGEAREFRLAAPTALSEALFDLTGAAVEPHLFRDTGRVAGGYLHFAFAEPVPRLHLSSPLRARAVLFTVPDGLVPAWYVELDVERQGGEGGAEQLGYAYVLSAHDGRLLFRKDLTARDAYTYDVWADPDGRPWDGPQGTAFSPHPDGIPNGLLPTEVAQGTVTLEAGPIGTLDPWLPSGATETRGNNVDAYADIASPDGFTSGDLRATITAANTFSFAWDPLLTPRANATQRQAAVTQLFVSNNFFHDWYYDVGFDEASGNAQADNFGRGGLGNDRLRAEAQDFSGTSNANMYTPADGARPRMQMYVFEGNAVDFVKIAPNGQQFSSNDATFGPETFDVTAEAALVNDGVDTPTDACETLTNNLTGKVAVIDRGTCTFSSKVKAAQNAGAIAAVIVNNRSGFPPPLYGTDATVVIPALSVSQTSGSAIKSAMAQGTVQLQVLRQSSGERDGTLDNAIVAHEWGHYISNRLIGNASGLDNSQGVGMGEGWGDFHALLMMVREEDAQVQGNATWGGVYGMAAWAMTGTPGNGLYYGLRRLPYSTDFSKNALTFKHIQDGVPLPSGVPTAFGSSGNNNAESHNTGEVWATMLWECYAALLNETGRLTFQQAQDRMRQYLVAGYKGTPNSPTLLEARDAILAAAFANDPLDYGVLADAFARRGAGQQAVAPSRYSQTNSPVVEDFQSGDQLFFVRAGLVDDVTSCDDDGALDNGETGTLTLTLRNSGTATLSSTTGTVTSATPGVVLGNGGQLTFAPSAPFAVTTATLPVTLEGGQGIAQLEFTVTYDDPGLSGDAPEPVTVTFRGNVEEVPFGASFDDVEAKGTLWTVGFNSQLDSSKVFERVEEADTGNHVWFGPNPESPADVRLTSPDLTVAPGMDFILTFRHRYDFEIGSDGRLYDGGVLELSANGGPFIDVGDYASHPYDGALEGQPGSNPLGDRMAWTGLSPGYPGWTTTTVNFGQQFANQVVQVRFRIGADDAAAHRGWELDDLAFEGIVGQPFVRTMGQETWCGNGRPVANVEPTATVNEKEELTLQGTATDPESEPLTFGWTQLEGPEVSLTQDGAGQVRFTAPEVTADQVVVLQLTANDGKQDSVPVVTEVTVKNVNHRPVAVLQLIGEAEPGSTATLDGSGSHDEDGEELTFTFTQVEGPAVNLTGSGNASSFVVPRVAEDAVLAFELVVNDGITDSEPVRAQLEVKGFAPAGGCGCHAGAGAAAAPMLAMGLLAFLLRGRRRR